MESPTGRALLKTTFAWLIELGTSPTAAPLYLRRDDIALPLLGWTRRPREAAQFPSRAEARAFAMQNIADPVRLSEHAFIDQWSRVA